jgi:Ca2+-binding RTX toxin-like protein
MIRLRSEDFVGDGTLGRQSWSDRVDLEGFDWFGEPAELIYDTQFTDFGIGVRGGRFDQIDFNESLDNVSEKIRIDFGGLVDKVVVKFGQLSSNEGFRDIVETGKWTAYGADGEFLDRGWIDPVLSLNGAYEPDPSTNYHIYPIAITTAQPLRALVIEATGFDRGTTPGIPKREEEDWMVEAGVEPPFEQNTDFNINEVRYERLSYLDEPLPALAPVARVTDGLRALYTFDAGAGETVVDWSGAGEAPLDLTVADPAAVSWGAGTLSVDAATVIASAGPADELTTAIRASGAFTLEAWITPAEPDQAGAARIVTLSESLDARNVTLGQGAAAAGTGQFSSVRLRTTETDPNGLPAFTADGLGTERIHVVYTRAADGGASLYHDGVLAASTTVGGDLSNWDPGYAFALANELTGDRPWLGTFDLVAVYDEALSDGEVLQNFDAGADANTPPLITDQRFAFAEDRSGVIGTVSARDPDGDDTLAYALTGGNDAGLFALDAATGELEAVHPLDAESRAEHVLTVAVDDGAAVRSATVTVAVTDGAEDGGRGGSGSGSGGDGGVPPAAEEIVWVGTAGADVFEGTAGDDVLRGDGGADELYGLQGDDLVDGGRQNDTVRGGGGDDVVSGDPGWDALGGDAGADVLSGGWGRDWLWGGAGDDVLRGDGGADTLFGQAGTDRLAGGWGLDLYVVAAGEAGTDWIFGFNPQEQIRFDGFGLSAAEIAARATVVGTGTTIDADADGSAEVVLANFTGFDADNVL